MSNNATRNWLFSAAAIGALALGSTPALAQNAEPVVTPSDAPGPEAGDTSPAAPVATVADDTIVVTARRKQENMQSVPVSVAALSADTLRQKSITQLNDLQFAVPGVFLSGAGSNENATYSIRGQGRATAGTGQPGVLTYFAEVPLPTLLSNAPTYDLSNVQVLKGPQGTLFGRNTVGGAVLIYPTAPTYNMGGYAELSYGNYNARRFEGAINVPILTDKVAVRIAGRLDRQDGFTKNLGTGPDLDDLHSNAVRGSLRLDPFEGLHNDLIVDYRVQHQAGKAAVPYQVLPIAVNQGVFGLINPPVEAQLARGPRTVDYGAFQPSSRAMTFGVFNRTNLDLGDVTLVNIFGYRRQRWLHEANTDGLPNKIGILDSHNAFREQQLTNETQLRTSFWNKRIDLTLGAFYLNDKPAGVNGTDLDFFFGAVNGRFIYQYNSQKSYALFGNAGVDLGDFVRGLKLNAGYRYTWDRYSACTGAGELDAPYTISPGQCSATNTAFVPGSAAQLSNKSSAPTWTLGLDYQLRRDVFVYATTRRGYRGGGLNLPRLGTALASVQSYDPEKISDIEIGAKTNLELGGVRTRLNVSLFRSKSKGVQYLVNGLSTNAQCNPANPVRPASPDGDCVSANDPASSLLLANVGDKVVKGVEFDANVIPFRGLSLGASGTILKQTTTRFDPPAAVAYYLASTTRIPFTQQAKQTYTANARYAIPLGGNQGEVVLGFDYFWSSKVTFTNVVAPSYDLSTARIDFNGVGGRPIDIGFFMRNVFDKAAVTGTALASVTAPVIAVLYTEPRMYGVQLRVRFGGEGK